VKTLLIAAALTFVAGLSAEVHKKDVDIKAPDGAQLKGTYFSAGRPGPAILLLHQCNMDRHAWDGLAEDLAGNGFHVLTVDFRGFGESGGEKPTDPAQRSAAREKWPGDVDAAYAYLTGQKGVDQAQVAVGGASYGVTQSSDLANPVTVTIGGKPGQVLFAGLAPGFAGLYQVNVTVPEEVTTGASVPVVLSVAGVSSRPVTAAIK